MREGAIAAGDCIIALPKRTTEQTAVMSRKDRYQQKTKLDSKQMKITQSTSVGKTRGSEDRALGPKGGNDHTERRAGRSRRGATRKTVNVMKMKNRETESKLKRMWREDVRI